ncbi:MAG: ATP-binding cassette domain-containing protein [Bacteroidales bacterium]|nr:ATP-binding cassette domain-containing protein [Bacteroidales bacterium]
MDFLIVEHLEKQYSGHKALNDVSINIPKGCIYGLLGPNGAGKTTTIRIINQIITPDSGRVLIDGEPLNPKHIQCIGYLPEERGLYKKMKVGEQAMYFAQLRGLAPKEAEIKLRQWFRKFDLMNWWDKKTETLSKGMQQKVQFIVTVVHEPKLLIFDEPFSGFDPINVDLIKNEILELKKNGATIIFSTHNMSSVEELCDYITLINKGKNILSGEINTVRESFSNNLFDVVVKQPIDDINALFSEKVKVVETVNDAGLIKICLQTMPEITLNEIIEKLLPRTEIVSFQKKYPSMHDIFIHEVSRNQN